MGILGDISVSKHLGFETVPFFRWFWIRLLKKFGIGFSIEKIRYQKKYWIWYWKNLVSEKSFGFVQILGIVTHCNYVTSENSFDHNVKTTSELKIA